jgi:hypothetical protein
MAGVQPARTRNSRAGSLLHWSSLDGLAGQWIRLLHTERTVRVQCA